MHLRLRLIDTASGAMVAEASVSGAYASTAEGGEVASLRHPSLGSLEVSWGGDAYWIKARGEEVRVGRYARLQCDDVELHATALGRPAGDTPPETCPRCASPLVREQIGGIYRSVASDRMNCPECEVLVLSLREARETLGEMSGESAGMGFVNVVTAMTCPLCGGAMRPATLLAGTTQVGVDACRPCGVVLLEPEDRRALEVALGAD